MLKAFITVLVGLFVDQASYANTLRLQDSMHGIPLGTHLEVLEDKEGHLQLEDVRNSSAKFAPSQQKHPNFGFTRSAYWARFQLENTSSNVVPVYLEYGYANTDIVSLYYQDAEGRYLKKEAGDQVSYATRDVNYRLPVFILDVPPGIQTYYVRVQTEGVNQIPLLAWSPTQFDSKRATEAAFLGVIYGFFPGDALL